MIYATGGPSKNCDGISRRSFLSAGTLGLGSFGLADLLRAESLNKTGSSNKSIIHIHLDGGPPQMDMIDPKPDSPVEYRGDIKSCLLYTSPSPRDGLLSRMPSSA